MPEYTMTAGGKFHSLSAEELHAALQQWMVDAVKGIRPVTISGQGNADSTGSISLGAQTLTGGALGPNQGYWWAVQRLAVRVDSVPAAYALYRNAARSHDLIKDVPGEANGYAAFGPWELMLNGGDSLVIRTQSTTPTTGLITVAGQAVEIPNQLLWKWMAG